MARGLLTAPLMADNLQAVPGRDAAAIGPAWDLWRGRLPHLWPMAQSYLKVLAGTSGRLVLQAVYFLTLANALSLHDMGVFAACAAAGLMLGNFAGLGFQSLAFRAAAGRRRLLGGYLALYYAAWALSVPLGLLLAVTLHALLFADSLPLSTFLTLLAADVVCWRLVEAVHQVNNGLGRYSAASLAVILASGARAGAALLFVAIGSASLDTWAGLYLAANAFAAAAAFALFRPRVRLRWRGRLFLGRLRAALLCAFSVFMTDTGSEIDKLILISLASERTAGIYAISTRIVDLTCVPMRTFYVLYSRRMIREGRHAGVVRRSLFIEAGIFALSFTTFAAFLALLTLRPGLLGANVTTAYALFGTLILVPAFRNLIEFHNELYFAYERLRPRAIMSVTLIALKSAALVMLASWIADIRDWGPWLNLMFAALYLVSALGVYRAVSRSTP